MTHQEIIDIIAADPALVNKITEALASQTDATPHWQFIADAVSAVAPKQLVSRNITDRAVIAALGTDVGDAVLTALEAVAAEVMAENDPLKPHQGGIRRMLAWLQRDPGLDIGSQQAQNMLTTLAQLGRMQEAHATALKALGQQAPRLSEYDIRCAVLAGNGTRRI